MTMNIKNNRVSYGRKIPFKKELRTLAKDFGLLDRPEVQEAIVNCQNYDDGRRKIMKAYEVVYMN